MKRKREESVSDNSDEELYHEKQDQKNQMWFCDICLKQYKNMKTLKQHMQSHTSRQKCNFCEKSYARLEDLRIHQHKIHGIKHETKEHRTKQKTRPFMCQQCKKNFNRKYHLTRHTALVHNRVTPRQRRSQFSCRHCDSDFQDYNQLFQHVMENHPLNQEGGRRATTPKSLNTTEQNQNTGQKEGNEWNDDNKNQQQEEQQGVQASHETADESALNNAVLNRSIHPRGSERYDVLTFFGNIREQVRSFLQSRANSVGGIKYNLCVQVEMQRDDGEDSSIAAPYFRSRTYMALSLDDLHDHDLNEAMQKMYASLEKYMREGSGWYVKKVIKLEIHTVIYKPLSGSMRIALPTSLALSGSLLNIQNSDDRCFLYCVLASLHPAALDPENVEHYRPYEHEVNMSGIIYPVTLSQISKVENQNEEISINVFTYEDKTIVPLRITKHRNRLHHVNVLWLSNEENSHYCLITDLNRFLSRTKTHRSQMYFCSYCLHGFCKETAFHEHQSNCSTHGAQRVELPVVGKNDVLKFNDYEKTLKVPFVIYADFETINRKLYTCMPNPKLSATTPTTKLDVCGFGYKVVCEDNRYTKPIVVYRGEDAGEKLMEYLLEEQEQIKEILSTIEPMETTDELDEFLANATHCCLCKKQFSIYDKTYSRIVRHHNHLTGEIIGPACNSCNLNCKQAKFIPVIFHNLKNFDAHILCEKLGKFKDQRLSCIAQNNEKYVSFSLGWLRFIDSFQFLPASLENLVGNLAQDGIQAFSHLLSETDDETEARLLLRKGVYPYEYMDSFDKFEEQNLPPIDQFYSTIKKDHISIEDYEHAQAVFQAYDMISLGEYHDLYLKTDVVLLTDVFESFRDLCVKQYELDPCHFYTSPGLSWSACLKMTDVRLELLTDIDQILMVEAGIRGGLSQISNRYKKANNPYLEGYDPAVPTTYLQYLDANNLYGWAMVQPLPVDKFEFMGDRDIESLDIMSIPETGDIGYILEVTLEYPNSLHDEHNCLPLAPVRKAITIEELSPYTQNLLRKMHGLTENDPLPNCGKVEKLLATLEDKSHYVLHYRNLQLYLRLGIRLKAIHRVLKFRQDAWMKTYIEHNTEMRKKARSTFEKNFYKLMNVSVFGKVSQNYIMHIFEI